MLLDSPRCHLLVLFCIHTVILCVGNWFCRLVTHYMMHQVFCRLVTSDTYDASGVL